MKKVRCLSLLEESIKNPIYVILLVIFLFYLQPVTGCCFLGSETYKESNTTLQRSTFICVLTSDIVHKDFVSESTKAGSHPVKRISVPACDEVMFTALYLKLGSSLTEQAFDRGRGLCGVMVVEGRGGGCCRRLPSHIATSFEPELQLLPQTWTPQHRGPPRLPAERFSLMLLTFSSHEGASVLMMGSVLQLRPSPNL